MDSKEKLFFIKTNGRKELFKVLDDMLDITVPVISSEAGLGKTTIITEYAKSSKYDIILTERLSGITDELLLGIPSKNEDGTSFDFLKLGFIKTIIENPDKNVFLFIDEINRAPERLRSALFALFEKKIDDIYYPNLHLVTAINIGDNYDVNWDISGDKALLSRTVQVIYSPDRADIIDYMEKHNYNKILLKIISRLDNLTEDITSNMFEQQSNLRSYVKLNHVFVRNGVNNITSADNLFLIYGSALFNKGIYHKISNIISTISRLEEIVSISDVIINGTYDEKMKDKEFEILLAIKDFALESSNLDITIQHISNIINLLSIKKEVFISFLQEANRKTLFDKKVYVKMIGLMDSESKKILTEIMKG